MKKLLIWDGDETLWSGTLQEGDNPVLPERRREFCRELANRGVLQALATYNVPEEAAAVLHASGLDELFLYNQATNDRSVSKASMCRAIINDYGLTREGDVVFVDDDPANRAEVKAALPEVVVLTVEPNEVSGTLDRLFSKDEYTEEDRLRVDRYRSEKVRRSAAAKADDRLSFLRSCDIQMTAGLAADEDLRRIGDLLERANRTAARAPGVESLADLRGADIYAARVRDRYGDYGLSACAALTHANELIAFVVSCRLQGRGIGSALLGWLIRRARRRGPSLTARWRETPYNAGIRQLFEWYGFRFEPVRPDGLVIASRSTERTLELPDWVTINNGEVSS